VTVNYIFLLGVLCPQTNSNNLINMLLIGKLHGLAESTNQFGIKTKRTKNGNGWRRFDSGISPSSLNSLTLNFIANCKKRCLKGEV